MLPYAAARRDAAQRFPTSKIGISKISFRVAKALVVDVAFLMRPDGIRLIVE